MSEDRNIALVLCVLAVACSAEAPANETPLSGAGGGSWGGSGAGGAWSGAGGGAAVASGGFPPGSGGGVATGSGGAGCWVVPLAPSPGNLFVLVDQSTAMAAPDGQGGTRWSAVVQALSEFASSSAGAGVGLGVQYFGLGNGGELFASCNPDDYAQAAVEIAALPGNGAALTASLSSHSPSARLPSAPALQGAVRYARSWRGANGEASLGLVLITGAVPDVCVLPGNPSGTDLVGDMVTVASEAMTVTPSVPVHVVGVASGLDALGRVAPAGGGSTHLLASADVKGHVLAALESIAATSGGDPCTLSIPPPPADRVVDPAWLRAYFTYPDGTRGNDVRQVASASQCDGSLQFYLDDPSSPSALRLCESACRVALAGTRLTLDVQCRSTIPGQL